MAKSCPHCKSSDLEVETEQGNTVCTNCGSVLEENAIVSQITIQENADGSASVVGQFVSNEGNYKPYLSGFQYGMGKESRQITLDNGKQQIRELAASLNLNRHCVDTAFNFFKLAIGKRLSRGRRIKHIVAACVYITCRTEATPHMLLDFSDATQVNVFTLGKVVLLLARELHIYLPVLDPCIYITRFAHHLGFGEKTHDVSMAAMRLVSRMKRDWIHTGRRPSGLCGAALLVAARLHGFNCEMTDIVKVVKIGHDTIRKRLTEFESTPSSKLTINEFMNIDLETEHDPPAFTYSRIKAKIQQLENEVGGMTNIESEIGKISHAIDDQLITKKADSSRKVKTKAIKKTEQIPALAAENTDDPDITAAAGFVHSENPEVLAVSLMSPKRGEMSLTTHSVSSHHELNPAPTLDSLGLNSNDAASNDDAKKKKDDGVLDLEGIDDEEIDKMILSPHETEIKARIWMSEYGEFVQEMEEKRKQRRLEAEKKEKHRPKTRKNKQVSRVEYYGDSKTAGEAIEKLVSRQKLSNKINYEALKKATEEEFKPKETPVASPPILLEEIPTKASGLKRVNESTDDQEPKKKMKAEPVLHLGGNETPATPLLETVVEENHEIVPVEEGEEDYEEDELDEDHGDEQCMSATQLMQHAGMSYNNYGEDADYDCDYD